MYLNKLGREFGERLKLSSHFTSQVSSSTQSFTRGDQSEPQFTVCEWKRYAMDKTNVVDL